MDQELREVLEGIRADIAGLDARLSADIAGLDARLSADIAGLEGKLSAFRAESAAGHASIKEALLTLASKVVAPREVREVESKLRKIG